MTLSNRLAASLCLLSGFFIVSCASTQQPAPPSLKMAAKADKLPPSLTPQVPVDKASLSRTSPHPGFYRKNGGLYATVKTTAYCHLEADSLKYGKLNAAGTQLRYDRIRSAAADWSVFPVGTLFRINGLPYIYRIDDYGSALVGTRTIDLYHPTKEEMRAWGARVVEIQILRWGSYSQSQRILAERSRHPHVKAMLNSMDRKRLVSNTTATPAR